MSFMAMRRITCQAGKTRCPVSVRSHFDVWQELQSVLDFIDEHGRWKSLEKKRRIFPGKAQDQRIIQADISSGVPAEVLQERGFSHLPCSRDQEHRKLTRCFAKEGFESSRDIHKSAFQERSSAGGELLEPIFVEFVPKHPFAETEDPGSLALVGPGLVQGILDHPALQGVQRAME